MGLKSVVARLRGRKKPRVKVDKTAQPMQGVNPYWRAMTDDEIAAGEHRTFVGGAWDEIGPLQLEFLKKQGLEPRHTLIDIGCGALRGGRHFVRYLDRGNYFGLDINDSLLDAGRRELAAEGLLEKEPNLLANDKFELRLFERRFDFGISVSVFTHLYMNHILRCLVEIQAVMTETSRYYITFFQAPLSNHLEPITHKPGGTTTTFDANPFHYSFEEMEWLAGRAGLKAELIGDWGHPRSQQMVCFTHGR